VEFDIPAARYSARWKNTNPLLAPFIAGGSSFEDCEYIYADNSKTNKYDTYSTYNNLRLHAALRLSHTLTLVNRKLVTIRAKSRHSSAASARSDFSSN
jgi:hypothetical protein